jgi:hypothetical protein
MGLSHIVSGVLFSEVGTSLGAGGVADYGVVALHQATREAVLEWVQNHLAAVVGFIAGLVYLERRSPRWLARCVGGAR